MSDFGEWVMRTRRILHLSQKELASVLHVKQNTISNWENGLNAPYDKNVIRHLILTKYKDKIEQEDLGSLI